MALLGLVLLLPAMLLLIALFDGLERVLEGRGPGATPPPPGNGNVPPFPPALPFGGQDDDLFQPVVADDHAFLPVAHANDAGDTVGALCLVCGKPKARGQHEH